MHSITDWRRIWDLHFCLIFFRFQALTHFFIIFILNLAWKKTDWLWLPRLFEHRGKRVGGGKLGRLIIWLTSMRENRGKRSHWDLYLGSCPFPFSSFYFFFWKCFWLHMWSCAHLRSVCASVWCLFILIFCFICFLCFFNSVYK